jgi:hypothetical protein
MFCHGFSYWKHTMSCKVENWKCIFKFFTFWGFKEQGCYFMAFWVV